LLGATPKVDATLRFEQGGITVEHAHVDGAQLRLAATGRSLHGDDNLRLEASARGPLQVGNATINGVVDATGRLTGRFVSPTLQADAQLASLTAVGVEIMHPDVQFTLAPNGASYRGHAIAHGAVREQPADAESDVIVTADGAIALPTLVAHVGALQATGTARIAPRGADAQLALSGKIDNILPGTTGTALGNVTLTPDTLTANARIVDGAAGDLRVRTATFTATGPYRAINAHFELHGRLRQAPLAFTGTALFANDRTTQARIEGTGALARRSHRHTHAHRHELATRWPRDRARRHCRRWAPSPGAGASMARALTGNFTITQAPLAPLASIWGERATGQIAGRFNMASNGDASPAMPTLRSPMPASPGASVARSPRTSSHTSNRPPASHHGCAIQRWPPGTSRSRRAGANQRRAHPHCVDARAARHSTLEHERPGRRLVGCCTLSGSGSARRCRWLRSTQLRAPATCPVTATSNSATGASKIRFPASSCSKCKPVSASAATALTSNTSPQRILAAARCPPPAAAPMRAKARSRCSCHDLRLVDRPDARARASGQIALHWQGLDSTLTGDLSVSEADVSVAQRPEAGIPQLDVIEINRPQSDEDDSDGAPPQQSMHPTRIDVRVRAPGRVFTRGRGVDAEWSLDLRLDGTSNAPHIYGNAQAVRGTLSLSGQPFEIQDGRIDFDGQPADARINLTAERDTADLTAKIQLTGTAADPDVTLTSDPALPEDEILPQVLFGRSVADLSALEAAQLAASLAALSGQASFDLVDAARAAAGLDRFNVREDESGGLLVAGGVYLTRDVYLEVARTGLGQAQTRVEWTLRPKLVLITSFLANGDQRASIRWRREGN